MSVAFWSVVLENGKSVEVQPPEGFVLNLQGATLVTNAKQGSQLVKVDTVSIEGDKLEAVVAVLRPNTAEQANLNLVFGDDVPITFSSSGEAKGKVYLLGYFQPGPMEEGNLINM